MTRTTPLPVLLLIPLSAGAVAAADQAARIPLDRPYVDPVNGFSLRPPLKTTRRRTTAAGRLVKWSRRDDRTGGILWTLSVSRRSEPKLQGADPGAWARQLASRLRKTDLFETGSYEIASLAARTALTFRGITKGRVKFWQRRVMIHLRKHEFLELRISGPINMQEKLDSIATAVLPTLKITDPEVSLARRKADLARGRELLDGLSDSKLSALIRSGPQWFVYTSKGKPVGFMLKIESLLGPAGRKGYHVRTWMMLKVAPGQVTQIRREMFATADRSAESWSESGRETVHGKTSRMSERGTKSGDQITSTLVRRSKTKTNNPVKVPQANYLPRAMAWLLHRVVDLKKPAAYAFATYDAAGNDFNLRTFTVGKPLEIELGGRNARAVRATDQLSADSAPATMCLDEKGNLLTMQAAGGLVMEAASEQAVTRRFPNAKETIRSMGRQTPPAPTGQKQERRNE